MIEEFFKILILLTVVFIDVIIKIFELPSVFNFWDETLFFLLLILFIVRCYLRVNQPLMSVDKMLLFLLCVNVLIGISGNYLFQYMTDVNYIFRDVVQFLKFPLTYLFTRYTGLDRELYIFIRENMLRIFQVIILLVFVFSIISLGTDIGMSQNEFRHGIMPYQFVYSHPTLLVSLLVMLLAVINFKATSFTFLFEIQITIIAFLTMRTKAFVWITLYWTIKYFGSYFKKHKTILLVILFIVGGFVAYDKVMLQMSFTDSPRQSMYFGAILLMTECFPIGSGFASFASTASAIGGSKVYNFIPMSSDLDWAAEDGLVGLGDAGFAYYLSQLGVLGTLVWIFVLMLIIKSISKKNNRIPISSITIYLYLLIALPTENILVNAGFLFGILLAVSSNQGLERRGL